LSPNTSCTTVDPFASSVSIHKHNPSIRGNGVTFYRESFYDDKGGWYKVTNTEITQGNSFYQEKLEDLKFKDVPKEEQDCVKWDFEEGDPEKNYCVEWEPPTLAGENISSIKIVGDYLVILFYWNSLTEEQESCQLFPTQDDVNKEGPKQIKWEYTRRQGRIPNYVLILH